MKKEREREKINLNKIIENLIIYFLVPHFAICNDLNKYVILYKIWFLCYYLINWMRLREKKMLENEFWNVNYKTF